MTLLLRPEQVEVLTEPRRADFERRLLTHVRRCFPQTSDPMTDAALAEVIHHGVERAVHYGIETERGVCRYVNLMFVFGRDFDQDDALSWSQQILSGARVHRYSSTIELLCRTARLHEAQGRGLHKETT